LPPNQLLDPVATPGEKKSRRITQHWWRPEHATVGGEDQR